MAEPRKRVVRSQPCQISRRSKQGRIFTDYLIQTSLGQMGALRPGVGGLLWEGSQQWLLLPLLLLTAAAPVAMGTSLAPRVSAAPPPPPSFPSNRPPPPALILACPANPAWSPGSPTAGSPVTLVAPGSRGFLFFWGNGGSGGWGWGVLGQAPLAPLCFQVLHLCTVFRLDWAVYMTVDWIRGRQRETTSCGATL